MHPGLHFTKELIKKSKQIFHIHLRIVKHVYKPLFGPQLIVFYQYLNRIVIKNLSSE